MTSSYITSRVKTYISQITGGGNAKSINNKKIYKSVVEIKKANANTKNARTRQKFLFIYANLKEEKVTTKHAGNKHSSQIYPELNNTTPPPHPTYYSTNLTTLYTLISTKLI